MGADDDPATVADTLDHDIVVVGPNGNPRTIGPQAKTAHRARLVGAENVSDFNDAVREAGVVVVALDGSSTADSLVHVVEAATGFVVAVCNGHGNERVDLSLLETVRGMVDVTLLACSKQPVPHDPSEHEDTSGARARRPPSGVAVGGAFEFVRMIRDPGQINLDLADAKTVLANQSLGVLARGTASVKTDDSGKAVRHAFDDFPASIDVARGSDALVSVIGGPELSIGDAVGALRAVHEEIGDIEELIWGVTKDAALADQVTVTVIVDNITYRPPLSAGDPCRRCGAALTQYTLGEQTTLACERCGFANLSMSMEERSGHETEI